MGKVRTQRRIAPDGDHLAPRTLAADTHEAPRTQSFDPSAQLTTLSLRQPSAPSALGLASGVVVAALVSDGPTSAQGGPLITPPTGPGIGQNVFQRILLDHDYTVASGSILYGYNLPSLFGGYQVAMFVWPDTANAILTNNGTIWLEDDRVGFGTDITYGNPGVFGFAQVVNNGLMYSHSVFGAAGCIVDADIPSGSGVTNTGQIWAISDNGGAAAVATHVNNPTLYNSGIIAAKGAHAAYAVQVDGGILTNTASGQILAEGGDAIAVSFWDEGTLTNAGLIEARSIAGGYLSVGIITDALTTVPELEFGNHVTYIVNSGIIRGDFAILAGSYNYYPDQLAFQNILNEATGLIDGLVVLGLGDDVLTNRGELTGSVFLEEGADLFDTTLGSWTGYTDLGWGNDTFYGSSGDDVAFGNRDADRLEGRGGGDLLMGGLGDDVLIGGAGSDGLYGEYGADRIVTEGGDFVSAGQQDDRIELGDLTFAKVDGGDGFDTLVMPAGGRIFDLSAAIATGRLADIEAIELGASQDIVIRASDVAALTGGEAQLFIKGVASDHVDLVGAWVQGSQQVVAGVTYQAWSLFGSTVLVQSGVGVVVGPTAPGGATGLDAVAAGSAAPVALAEDFSSNITSLSHFLLHYDLVIEAYETWTRTDGESPWDQLLTVDVLNRGTILVTGPLAAIAVASWNSGAFTNDGLVKAVSGAGYVAEGISFDHQYGPVINNGTIEVIGSGIYSYGVATGAGDELQNHGLITVSCDTGQATGVGGEYVVKNTGQIIVQGASAIGVQVANGFLVENSGLIRAVATSPGALCIGIQGQGNNSTIINTGTIEADRAIQLQYTSSGNPTGFSIINSGLIKGDIWITPDPGQTRNDTVVNTGTIQGAISLGGLNDVYDGASGQQSGGIIDGGDGNDTLVGDTGDDTMTGGTGADWFRAIAFGFGNDTVTDFENGVDKLRFTGMAGVDDFSDFVISTNGSGWAVVTLSDGSSITLTGMLASDVDASDFLFV